MNKGTKPYDRGRRMPTLVRWMIGVDLALVLFSFVGPIGAITIGVVVILIGSGYIPGPRAWFGRAASGPGWLETCFPRMAHGRRVEAALVMLAAVARGDLDERRIWVGSVDQHDHELTEGLACRYPWARWDVAADEPGRTVLVFRLGTETDDRLGLRVVITHELISD
jgi:hypothetical protein